ncbi:innexin inx2 isoform X2 [Eurytemora carolleeae]|uniref:innexin inx2 isoform X2 n=1 Tax=Eurytemora carolleeae TaxID=1294199 RepID=UPI000C78387C|nr:innexin inx2 isoform X2 [Eurytemora carolleeae]|eukprot:XP_023321260.1 innexin inx2-like isoform X2 [Eurytemora affinis]
MAYAWTLLNLGLELKREILEETGPDINGVIFRLHYKVTSSLLLLCGTIITMVSWFGSKPVSCTTNSQITGVDFDSYCWIHPSKISTQTTKWTDEIIQKNLQGIGGSSSSEEHLFHCQNDPDYDCLSRSVDYYQLVMLQWSAVFLMFQALCFYASRFVWSKWENGTMEYILKTTERHESIERKAEITAQLILYRSQRGKNKLYALGYMLAECSLGLNLAIQWAFTCAFLGVARYGNHVFNFYNLGWYSIFYDRRRLPSMLLFPTLSGCTYMRYGEGGGTTQTDLLCLLPLNIIHDKIFLFQWFWFALLSFLTCSKLLYRICVFLSAGARERVLRYEMSKTSLFSTAEYNCILRTFSKSHSDFVFLEILNKNAEVELVQNTMRKFKELKEKSELSL